MHSVNACINNDGGTVLDMSGMDSILGLEAHGVRVQAGCRMADIHDYLAEHVRNQQQLRGWEGCQHWVGGGVGGHQRVARGV